MKQQATSLVELLRQRADTAGADTAYIFIDGARETVMTYAQLHQAACAIAGELLAVAAPGARVVILTPPGPEFVKSFFGCLYARMIAVPSYPPDLAQIGRTLSRFISIVENSTADVILGTQQILEHGDALVAAAPALATKAWVAVDTERSMTIHSQMAMPQLDDVAFLQYTSGSTGTPKGVILTHRNLLHNLKLIADAFDIDSETMGMSWLPPYHDMGLIGGILAPMSRGRPTALMSPLGFLKNPLNWLRAIQRHKATISGGPNFAFELCVRKLAQRPDPELDLSSWKLAFTGAEPIRLATLKRFARAFEYANFDERAFYPCYGLAESTLIVTGGPLHAAPRAVEADAESLCKGELKGAKDERSSRQMVCCGTPCGDLDVRIVDPIHRTPCAPDQIGEVWVAGESVAQGYWENAIDSRNRMHAKLVGDNKKTFLRTGDLGVFSDGELLVAGRLNDLLIIRGRNHYPQDVEATVEDAHPALRRGCSAAFAIDVNGVEELVVVVEVERRFRTRRVEEVVPESKELESERRGSGDRRGGGAPDLGTLSSALGAEGPGSTPYQGALELIRQAVVQQHGVTPHTVVLLRGGALPKTSSGKIQRSRARRLYLDNELFVLESSTVGRPPSDIPPSLPLSTDQVLSVPQKSRPAWISDYIRSEISKRLRLDPQSVDVDKPFTAMGFDSMAAVELTQVLEETLGAVVPMVELLRDATIASLTTVVIDALDAPNTPDADEREGSLTFPLSEAQSGLVYLHHLYPDSSAYNLATAMRLRGPYSVDALSRALDTLRLRHPMLSARIIETSGELMNQMSDERVELEVKSLVDRPEQCVSVASDDARRPFRVTEGGPLWRACLYRLSDTEAVLMLAAHHVVVDFWSLVVLLSELRALYDYYSLGKQPMLPAARFTYAQYIRGQQKRLSDERLLALESYWKSRLEGAPTRMRLSSRVPRTPPLVSRARRYRSSFPQESVELVRTIAKAENTTPFVVYVSFLMAALSAMSGDSDVVIGSPVGGRNAPRAEGIVGFLANLVTLRSEVNLDESFTELLSRTKETVLSAIENSEYPFHRASRLAGRGLADGRPTVDVVFVLQKAQLQGADGLAGLLMGVESASDRWGDVDVEALALEPGDAQFDLNIGAIELDAELSIIIDYNEDRFSLDEVKRLLGLVERAVLNTRHENRAQRLREAFRPSPSETQQLLALGAAAPVESADLAQLWLQCANENHDRIAFKTAERSTSYGELLDRVRRVAGALKQAGVGPGDAVMLQSSITEDFVTIVLASVFIGAAYVPVGPAEPVGRLPSLASAVDARVVITDGKLEAPDLAVFAIREIVESDDVEPELSPAEVADSSVAYIMFTSGSTGAPKPVVVERRGVVRLARMPNHEGVRAGDSVCPTSHPAFDASTMELWVPLLAGACLVFMPRHPWSMHDLTEGVRASQASFLFLTSALFEQLARTSHLASLVSLRSIMTGGDVVAPQAYRAIQDALPQVRIINAYGPTENTTYTTLHDVKRLEEGQSAPIGRPVRGTSTYLLDSEMNLLPRGAVGELYTGGIGVARGYYGQPGRTAERFLPDPFEPGARVYRTGDLARWNDNGELEFHGRADRQVKVRGLRIELAALEDALLSFDEVEDAACVVKADELVGKRLVAYLASSAGRTLDAAQVKETIRNRLGASHVPDVVSWLPALPVNANGKIDRKELANRSLGDARARARIEPRNAIEQALLIIWKEELNVEDLGVEDNFFAYGGSSLLAMRIASEVRELLGVDLSIRQLTGAPTIRSIAQALEQAGDAALVTERARTLVEVSEMSEEEAATALAARGRRTS